jgi:hypothetical protein
MGFPVRCRREMDLKFEYVGKVWRGFMLPAC